MKTSLLLAAGAAAAAAALTGCTEGPDAPTLYEHRFDDVVVRVVGDAASDMVAEVERDGTEVATLDWDATAARGTLATGGQGFAVEFDAPVSIAPERLAEIAHELWLGVPVGATTHGALCLGTPTWECCLTFPEIIRCHTY